MTPMCPKCKKPIDHIVKVSRANVVTRLHQDGSEEPVATLIDYYEFECPKCYRVVADNEQRASEILGIAAVL